MTFMTVGAEQGTNSTTTDDETLVPNEQTPLLIKRDSNSSNGGIERPDDGFEDDNIEPSQFDEVICHSESYNSGLGTEPMSQEVAMLRGPRKYTTKSTLRRASTATQASKQSFRNTTGIGHTIEEVGDNDEGKSPYLAGVSVARFWLIFGGTLTTSFVAAFDSTIMFSSHPIITSYFHSSNSASWLSTAFLLTSTSFQPLFGRLSDTVGRKVPYIFTLIVFLLATIWCGAAESMLGFIMARAVCGLGAGGMVVMGSIITSDLVPIEIRGVYQSYINIVAGVGAALGAASGGILADNLGWRWEFYLQAPAIAFCLITACVTVPSRLGLTAEAKQRSVWEAMKVFDIKGSLLLTTSITFLILGLNLGGNVYPWSHPFVLTSLTIFSICCPLFIYVESKVPLPIMPLGIVLHNPRAGLIFSNALGTIIAFSVLFNIPIFFQAVLLESATDSGLRLVVPSVAASAAATATGFLITWNKRLKSPLVTGTIFVLLGTIGLALMRKEMPNWIHILLLIPTSVGQGFLFPGAFMAVLAVSEQAEQAVVTSTSILWRSLGNVLGVALSSLVLQNALRIYLDRMVMGPEKESIIDQVRTSVTAIAGLEAPYRDQVIDAYAASLSVTFMVAAFFAIILVLVIMPLRLPRLGQRSK